MMKWLLLALSALLLAACGSHEEATQATAERTLTVLAGSELKDVEPLLPRLQAATGIALKFEYAGTLDGIERLQAGEAFDAAWFSHAKYLMLDAQARGRVKASEKIMLSPVIVGIKESRLQALGWQGRTDLGWKDIAAAAARGQFRFAMTSPVSSNSGFSALIGVASSFAGHADALSEADVARLDLAGLFKGHALTAGSSGWLAERYLAEQDRLDGMINYESVLLALAAGKSGLKEPLRLIHPRDGIVTADYPLLLLDERKRALYDQVVAWLKGEEAQRWLMRETQRRPVNPALAVEAQALFATPLLSELPFPGDVKVIERLLFSYLGEQRRPAHADRVRRGAAILDRRPDHRLHARGQEPAGRGGSKRVEEDSWRHSGN